ncbi:hypothetical protein [Pontibacter flavimaris]|uniref:hypothetical protein n=1 Tax=Pontibacter flavimaris TaxID=1797110 RepID=UPI00147C5CC9|nr:hypothetical protein [Pontibacter flavimaris]
MIDVVHIFMDGLFPIYFGYKNIAGSGLFYENVLQVLPFADIDQEFAIVLS